mgnify:FL=1
MQFHNANTAVFTRADAKALAAFASTDQTRQHLNCVLVDFARGAAVATDGHRLAKANSAACFADAAPCLVPLDAWTRAIKACSKSRCGILVRRAGAAVRLDTIDPGNHVPLKSFGGEESPDVSLCSLATVETRSLDVQFPPYERVIPDMAAQHADTYTGFGDDKGEHPRAKAIGFNMRYLGDVQLTAEAAGCKGAELHPGPGPLDPLVALCNGSEGSWTVVVMPIRI